MTRQKSAEIHVVLTFPTGLPNLLEKLAEYPIGHSV